MSTPIMRLFATVVLLFALLVAWTSKWSVFDAKALRDNPHNVRPLLVQLHVKRGAITAADGTVLARSVHGPRGTYGRTYPTGSLFGHPVGYANVSLGQLSGIERFRNDVLSGQTGGLGSLADQLQGKRQQGDNVVTTLDPAAQRIAEQQLASVGAGAVVALDPRTGAVKVMASTPGYDPNTVGDRGVFAALNSPGSGAPLLNRATESSYAARLDVQGRDRGGGDRQRQVHAGLDHQRRLAEEHLGRADAQRPEHELRRHHAHGRDDELGQHGLRRRSARRSANATMAGYMRRFGFYQRPPLDYPADEMLGSGERLNGRLLPVQSPQVDVGRMAIGQDKLAVTPMQMAMVVAAVANGGELMAPHLTDRVVDPDGRTVSRIRPRVWSAPIMPRDGRRGQPDDAAPSSSRAPAPPSSCPASTVAGKTGTAEIGSPAANLTQPSFVAFAPADNPRIAIAVMVDRSQGGFGGTVAAPIARAVLQSLLQHP